jgi:class 3 adenylate cyclase/tetratricopeptide (TPR) repeat protein
MSAARPTVAVERRLVSVLFADLVGFTPLSESRDPEDVRELLSSYFDVAAGIVGRYGGLVEKFIGDAVMAVWGIPVAQEDDAERAVRAALDLVSAIREFGRESAMPELAARAAVLTGEVAVNLGASGQGMVAGDLVNTASRVQGAADPGTVLVGETTRRATEASIAYVDAGRHELKGKAESVPLWRALRVTAGRAGGLKSEGLEPPFVGRDRELRLAKELFHATAEEGKAHLLSITGIAGIGKSRLAWELYKYFDGIAAGVAWHRGRCLAYGDGVTFWALAEMVRMRAGITDGEGADSASRKLDDMLELAVEDPEERRWIQPRLAQLLVLESHDFEQADLFGGWRLFFERIAERDPVVLVFEDMQWADAGLLDFLDYLLDWSRNHPIFVVTLARPELADKHPTWAAGKRAVTSLYLEPLAPQVMQDLLTGLVPGLSEDLQDRILARAQGVPLYAVETVRMLLNRGLLAQEGNVFRPQGAIETLEVPETLHALVAARLDGLTAEERRLVQDAAVLGKTFTKQGLGALAGLAETELEPLLASLLRKEVLSIQADPRSPDRGQYAFLQDIVKHVAYETLSKRERKEKHLAAALYLASVWGGEEDEIVEVVAAHYLDAYTSAPEAPDAAEIRERARELLVRAAERAASLGANGEAQRAFERALELTEDDLAGAALHERAGMMAAAGARVDQAGPHLEQAIGLFESAGATHPAARVSARLAEIAWDRGRLEDGLERMNRAFEVLAGEEPDEDVAALAAQLGRFTFFAGDAERALQRVETALDMAEALSLPEVLAQALNTKAIVLNARGRQREAVALMSFALETALEHEKPSAALRAYYNLAEFRSQSDRYEEAADTVAAGLALARKVGSRYWEYNFLGQLYPFLALGRWDEVVSMTSELPEARWSELRGSFLGVVGVGVQVNVHRGALAEAERIVELLADFRSSADTQEQGSYWWGAARIAFARGEMAEALRLGENAWETQRHHGVGLELVKEGFVVATEAALALGELAIVDRLLADAESLPLGRQPQFLRAQSARFRGRLAALAEDGDEAERRFKGAAGLFREMAMPFYLAVMQLEHAEWLVAQSRADEADGLLAEARETFERLEATPWLERCDAVIAPVARIAAGTD